MSSRECLSPEMMLLMYQHLPTNNAHTFHLFLAYVLAWAVEFVAWSCVQKMSSRACLNPKRMLLMSQHLPTNHAHTSNLHLNFVWAWVVEAASRVKQVSNACDFHLPMPMCSTTTPRHPGQDLVAPRVTTHLVHAAHGNRLWKKKKRAAEEASGAGL